MKKSTETEPLKSIFLSRFLPAFIEWIKDHVKRMGKYKIQKKALTEKNYESLLTFETIPNSEIVTKSMLQNDDYKPFLFDRITSTSGTTGKPLVFYQSIGSLQREQAFIDWIWEASGFSPNQKIVVMRGSSQIKLYSLFFNRLLLSSFEWDNDSIAKKYKLFTAFKPDFVDCYPSILERFLKICIALGYKDL